MRKTILIVGLALLGGCTVNSAQFSHNLSKQDMAGAMLGAVPEMAYCFNVPYDEAKRDLDSLFSKHFSSSPITAPEISTSEAMAYGESVSEKVVAEYLEKHRATFLTGPLTIEQARHCSSGFGPDLAVSAQGKVAKK